MSAGAAYGTQPDTIAAVLQATGDAAMVLSYAEDRACAALALNRFGSIGSTRLDWHGAEVLRRSTAYDGAELRSLLHAFAGRDELAVVWWGNLAVPSIALEARVAARCADEILDCGPECWIHLMDSDVLIEFQDGEGFTAGRPPR
ncbi:hypothetical protein [Streptomyces sp. NRRL S-118]|uniref:hypothetical protein n=1 Tax=Streptomyces sp. NRRL S-118 TaxID=1463881 RepID=UPI0004C7ED2F|nr:hypothetical protein [Streptomyces sp. NRRL S-118]